VRGEQKETSDLRFAGRVRGEPIGLVKYVTCRIASVIRSDRCWMKSGLKPRLSRQVLKEVIYV
jgi:hypothetical protein